MNFLHENARFFTEKLLGSQDTSKVSSLLISFAKTDVYTEYAIPDLPGLVNRILLGETDKPLSPKLQNFLAGFAFETVGASTNWFIKKGEIHDAAILVWVYAFVITNREIRLVTILRSME